MAAKIPFGFETIWEKNFFKWIKKEKNGIWSDIGLSNIFLELSPQAREPIINKMGDGYGTINERPH